MQPFEPLQDHSQLKYDRSDFLFQNLYQNKSNQFFLVSKLKQIKLICFLFSKLKQIKSICLFEMKTKTNQFDLFFGFQN